MRIIADPIPSHTWGIHGHRSTLQCKCMYLFACAGFVINLIHYIYVIYIYVIRCVCICISCVCDTLIRLCYVPSLSLPLSPLSLQTGILMGTFAQASQEQQHNPLIFRKERSHGTAGRWAECGGCADVLRPNCRWQLQQARWSCSGKKWTTVPPKLEMICIHFIL